MSKQSVLHLVVCAAPPASHIHELVSLLIADRWQVQVIATATAASWVDGEAISRATGHRVRQEARRPDEPKTMPPADAILVAPATFNTINQWALGINNTAALGVLNEALGLRLPILVSPYVKPALTNHPAYARHLAMLSEAGVTFTGSDALRPVDEQGAYRWTVLTKEISAFR